MTYYDRPEPAEYDTASYFASDLADTAFEKITTLVKVVEKLDKKLERVKNAYTGRSNDELTEQQLMDILDDVCY